MASTWIGGHIEDLCAEVRHAEAQGQEEQREADICRLRFSVIHAFVQARMLSERAANQLMRVKVPERDTHVRYARVRRGSSTAYAVRS